MRTTLVALVVAAAFAAGADEFSLGGGIAATTSPVGGVTFRAKGVELSFAPFECAPSEKGIKPAVSFRADGDALVAEVAGDPAAFGRVSFGRCSAMPKELYFGYGYCVRDPGRLNVPLNGHHNATRFAGFTFANGLSLVLATTTAPDALFVDPEKGAFGFACSQPTTFTFVPGRAGAFDCALRARRHFAEKAPAGFAAKAGRFCVDTWNGSFAQHERLIRRCAEYGLRDDLLFYVHCWQRYGFDRHLPDVYPPSPTFGTAAELKRACATARAHGWSFGVHLNVIDCYTNSPWFDWSKISHDVKGRPIKAWINPPYQEQSYRLLPECAPASISYQVESLLADGLCPDTVFVDVTGSGAMSSGTCRDAAGRVHPLIANTAANGRMFDTARTLLEQAGKRPAFVSSEAPCDYLAGHMDGGDCQWMFLSHEKDVYRWMTIGGTGLVTKVPWMPLVWHDRLSLHGAGYSARFEGARGEDCHGIDSDDYISCEIMNGHSLMADCYNRDAYKAEAGILDAIDEPRCLRQIVRKYWLAQHVAREIGAASVQGVSFPDGDPRHVKVVWSTGMTAMVNRDVRDWAAKTGDAGLGDVILPQYGFVAFNPKTGNYASIRRRGRRVVEESAYRDGAKTVRYVNPRGADTARNRLPLAPATTVSHTGDRFRATVTWQPFRGMPVPKGNFRVSLWLLDPMFREYSPKEAALRVATADVTLDRPTEFSFAWPKGVKGPRVAHVAVAPVGADADNPDLRFKLLGTSAFYRRYRQGSLASNGTWTPYRCPDENLWERLFPPSEPVDYGWVTTDEAFRLVTEPGRPDVKIPLPAGLADEAVVSSTGTESVTVDVAALKPGHEVPASLWGIFLEDIAFSVDGCLYPELVWNRGFEFRAAPSDDGFEKRLKGPTDLGIPGWSADCRRGSMGRFTLQYAKPLRADTPAYLRMEAFSPFAGVRNTGPMGEMDVKGGEPLNLSLYARGDVPLIVRVESADNKILCEKHFHPKEAWRRFSAVVTPKASAKKAHLLILAAKAGTAEIDYVSLMPAKTFKGHGLRKDIAQLIADLKPANFRFPGGCMLESCDYAGWFDWKRTVGAPEARQPLWNIWGYYQNVGLGFYEYFVFCEDIGAEPLPVFIGGRTCQFRNSKLFPKENLGWLVTNMLDAVEFIRGPTNTTWGALRAKMGHPSPFPLKTIGIGNENWGKEYYSRFYVLAAGVKAVHPDLKVIAAIDPHVIRDPPRGKESWAEIRKGEVDFADEHMYASPSYWLNHADRYDSYPRDHVPVYIGEWGTRDIRPDWIDGLYVALAEAAFRIGIEKNSDVVKMVAYAPLARRRAAPRDGFSLLDVTTDAVCGNPTYYAEKMFTHNRPERVVPVSYPKLTTRQPAGWDREKSPFNPKAEAIDVVAFHAGAGLAGDELVVKLVNAAPEARPVTLNLDVSVPAGKVAREVLSGAPGAKNTPEEPLRVVPKKDELPFSGGKTLNLDLAPYSFTVLRLRR